MMWTLLEIRNPNSQQLRAKSWLSFYFIEFRVDERLDGVDRRGFVLAIRFDGDSRAAPGGEQEDAEDRLAIDLFVAFADLDVGTKSRGGVDELRGGACVQAELVFDLDVALDHDAARRSAVSSSEATRIAFDPFSLIVCATAVRSLPSCGSVANFTTIGRLTPVMISTRSFSRNERLMLLGVPPNMSGKMMTPPSGPTRSGAMRIFSRPSSTESVHPSGTASMTTAVDSILRAALSSSFARFPCVTIRAPINQLSSCSARMITAVLTALSLAVAVDDLDRVAARGKIVREALSDGDGAVFAAGAADADGEVALHLFLIFGQQVGDEIEQLAVKDVVSRLRFQIRDDL